MKKIISLLLLLAICVTLVSPAKLQEAQAAETAKPIQVSAWAVPTLIMGDTYGIYPLTWYEKDLSAPIKKGKLKLLTYGVRGKLVDSGCVEEKRFANLAIDDSITVKEALVAFYTLLTNYDYKVDLGLNSGLDPVAYMQQIGVYTGQNGEQGLKDLCSMEQAMVFATRIIAVLYEAMDASSEGFLWEVKSGENTVYLLGSIHLASNDIYPFSNEMWTAYYNSSALVVEANLYDAADTAALSQLMYYTDGTTLKDHVSADTYQKAIKAAGVIGIPETTAAHLKPWALYLTFESYELTATSADYQVSAQLGIDMTFQTNATMYQKPIYAIEGMEKQGKIIDSFSEGLQEYLLNKYSDIVNGIDNGTDTESAAKIDQYMDAMLECWKTGDIEGFKALIGDDEEDAFTGELTEQEKVYEEEYQKILITQRDDAMAEHIDKLLKSEGSNSYFVVLGSAHYISDYSIIDRLIKQGYEVKQVK